MSTEPTVILVRTQSWFKPFIETEGVPAFPEEALSQFRSNEFGQFNANLVLGTGPLTVPLSPSLQLYFEVGESDYPVFVSPIHGPTGGNLRGQISSHSVEVGENEAVFLIQLTGSYIVSPDFADQVSAEFEELRNPESDDLSPEMMRLLQVKDLIAEASDKLVGAYALYQPALVWERLAVSNSMSLYHRGQSKGSPEKQSVHIPVKVRPASKLDRNSLKDGVAEYVQEIASMDLLLPLRYLTEATIQQDPVLRFMNYFWILEHLSVKKCGTLPDDAPVRDQFSKIRRILKTRNKAMADVFSSWKTRILKKDLMDSIGDYHQEMGIRYDFDLCNSAKRLRNKLSHGLDFDREELLDIEPKLGHLVRQCLRKELESERIILEK